jgi:hypothetical protein
MKPLKWPFDWNRPLSREERDIAKRLDRAPENEPLPSPTKPGEFEEGDG